MKIYIGLAALAVLFFETSCTKDKPPTPHADRIIRFVLYTQEDFSENTDTISFSLFIKNHGQTLFDSSLLPMRLKDIPDFAHKLVFEKKVRNNDGSDLAVGFLYTIQNVGSSWHTDTCKSGSSFKEVAFPFQ